MDVVSNGRLIFKHCGHIAFPNDLAFRCSCLKCLEIALSPFLQEFGEYSGGKLKVKAVLTVAVHSVAFWWSTLPAQHWRAPCDFASQPALGREGQFL